jgi:hypothetical protein
MTNARLLLEFRDGGHRRELLTFAGEPIFLAWHPWPALADYVTQPSFSTVACPCGYRNSSPHKLSVV